MERVPVYGYVKIYYNKETEKYEADITIEDDEQQKMSIVKLVEVKEEE